MVEIRADIHFKALVTNYINETQRKRNVIIVDLFHFSVGNWHDFKHQYPFNIVHKGDPMMNVECHISAKDFLELVGKIKVEATEKLQMRDLDSSGLKAWGSCDLIS